PVSWIVPKELKSDVYETMREQMIGHLGVIHTETTRIHKQGKKVHVQLTRIPLKDVTGKTVALMALFKDISEQKKLQKEKIQLKSEQIQLQKKLETLEQNTAMARVAAKVAHEIRQPLGVLFLKSDLLLEKLNHAFDNWGRGDPDVYHKSLDKSITDIKRQISRLEEIANNYLHLSKSRTMEREDIHIQQFMKELETELKEQYSCDDLTLQCSCDPNAGAAYFDPQQFQRVFANLVRNSREAIQNANISEGIIQIQADRRDQNLIFRIIDNGPGMPEEIRKAAFDPFTTTKSIGTGLGLYLTCEIVENHGGTIMIDSEPDRGTSIEITIPVEDQNES
ncbi:MAG: ATP-binding protein, partial [Candidatus Hinthialibacter sp.]